MTYANYRCGDVRLMTMFNLFERLRFIREAVCPAVGGCCAGLDPELAEQPAQPGRSPAPSPRRATRRS